MGLLVLEMELAKVFAKIDTLNFIELIRECRDAVGMKQNFAALQIGITPNRLKNLECGFFQEMPNEKEIAGIARLYDLKISILEQKAMEFVKKKKHK